MFVAHGATRPSIPMLLGGLLLASLLGGVSMVAAASSKATVHNPLLKSADAIKAGRMLYTAHCMVCHGTHGSRGPDLFQSHLSDQDFMDTVMSGRTGSMGQMPSWGGFLTVKQVWEIEAFVKSRPHY